MEKENRSALHSATRRGFTTAMTGKRAAARGVSFVGLAASVRVRVNG